MNARTAISRIAAMDRHELGFRLAVEGRKRADAIRYRISRPQWMRQSLARILDPAAGPLIAAAVDAAHRGSFVTAQQMLEQHFCERASVWPISARRRVSVTSAVASKFPNATAVAAQEARRLLDGRCDLLGYHDLRIGAPPDWDLDPVHGRRPPHRFWAEIPYLDPAIGDHKVLWEINRHQQWFTLGRAYWLTGDPQFRDAFIAQISDWIAHNPPLTGIHWASMLELAFRSLSWTWALEFFAEKAAPSAGDDGPAPWLVDLLIALDRQLDHVSRNLSLYFSPNTHLSGEALALYAVSTALPELRRSRTRASRGRGILLSEATRQVLPDGGHVERSAHYHRYSTDFYLLALLVARRAQDPAAAAFEHSLRAQAEYLRVIADDRGRLPLIGDDDGGQLFAFGSRPFDAAPTLNAAALLLDDPSLAIGSPGVETYWILGRDDPHPIATPTHAAAGRQSSRARLLPDSGYFVDRQADSQLIFDVGPHGFLNAGHAHGDALAIVATVDGDPLLVDPGTATYTMDAAVRDRFRSPRMHNTLTLDGRDFTAPSGPFHWKRIADARVLRHTHTGDIDLVQATHDGYPDRRHVRTVVVLPQMGWLVVDHVLTDEPTLAETWWHLHPSWTASVRDGRALLRHSSGRRSALAFAGGTVEVVVDPTLCAYAPEYGRIERAQVLRVAHRGMQPVALGALIPGSHVIADTLRIRQLTAIEEPPPEGIGSTWRIEANGREIDVFVGPRWPQPCIEQQGQRVSVG